MASTQEDADLRPKSKRMFINHVDQYQGKNLAQVSNYVCFFNYMSLAC